MTEGAPNKRRLGPFHMAVLAIWTLVCAWLVGSFFIGVVDALFFGDGHINQPPSVEVQTSSTVQERSPTT